MIAVADGVGGWAERGVDPGLFSKQLCRDFQTLFNSQPSRSLKDILLKAVTMNDFTGSSTACLAKLVTVNNKTVMQTTNLGDSGYILYRAYQEQDKILVRKVFRSKE
jgi:protein phosphatase PTC7